MTQHSFIYDSDCQISVRRCHDDCLTSSCMTSRRVTPSHVFSQPFTIPPPSRTLVSQGTYHHHHSDDESDINRIANWQRSHPSLWTNSDVLDVIYFIAELSSSINVERLMGERFQNIDGRQLQQLSKEEFIERDQLYGELLYDTLYQLLKQCCFIPPEEPQSIDHFGKKRKTDDGRRKKARELIPKPVEDLTRHPHEDDYDSLPTRNGVVEPWLRYHGDNNGAKSVPSDVVRIYGHAYDIDCLADFPYVAQSTTVAHSVEDTRHYVEYDFSDTANTPIDLSTRRPSQQHSHVDHRTTPPPNHWPDVEPMPNEDPTPTPRQTTVSTEKRKKSRCSAKEKRLASSAKRAAGPARGGKVCQAGRGEDSSFDDDPSGVNGGGRHLWEFIRDLLGAADKLSGGLGTVVVYGESDHEEKTYRVPIDTIIRWENRNDGVFRIIDSKKMAQLWGRRKHNSTMTYEKLSRALRWCRKNKFFAALPKDCGYPKKLCFKFGPLAKKWKTS